MSRAVATRGDSSTRMLDPGCLAWRAKSGARGRGRRRGWWDCCQASGGPLAGTQAVSRGVVDRSEASCPAGWAGGPGEGGCPPLPHVRGGLAPPLHTGAPVILC
jgi:hypothetical protein